MNITVYLPDELGIRAKDEELPFSRLLRRAVEQELGLREELRERLAALAQENGKGWDAAMKEAYTLLASAYHEEPVDTDAGEVAA